MRLVRYSPQERVDLPDITAMSFLVLGELRRTMRGLVIGPRSASPPTHANFIIRGFAAEPSGVPDAIVTVRLVPTTGGGRPLGFAVGAEDLTARTDFGQLIGGEDQAGNTEGNATATFDFTGQPLATYRLQMRFTYQAGAIDNRAFWDAATNTEFIAAEDTRFLSAYALGISVSPGSLGDEWIPIADVVWDGASIDAADITDIRTFLHEGASPFGATTQAAYAAIPDFDRSDTRASAGVNEIYPVMRALARQVADIKGQDSSGNFNWYARAAAPFSDTNSALAAEQTKGLTSVDVTTYTIGDGVSTFGDFNGAAGLETCLQHLEDLAAQVPDHVRVVLKANNAASFTWNITTAHQYNTAFHLELIGRGGDGSFNGQTEIDFTAVPAVGSAINMMGGHLTMKNIATVGGAPAVDIGGFGASTGGLYIENCRIVGSDTAPYSSAVFSGGNNVRLINSEISGLIQINTTSTVLNSRQEGSFIENCFINDGGIFTVADAATEQAQKITIRNTDLLMNQIHGFARRGAIDLASASGVLIDNCRIEWVIDVDGVHIREVSKTPGDVKVSNTIFTGPVVAGVHASGTGLNGLGGTGWGIYAVSSAANSGIGDLYVHGCTFNNLSIDAGGIKATNVQNLRVSECVWRGNGGQAGANTYLAIDITENGTNLDGEMDNPAVVVGCQFGPWNTVVNQGTSCIQVTDVLRGLQVSACTFLGNDFGAAANDITGRLGTVGACIANQGTTSRNIAITGCGFARWEPNLSASRCIDLSGASIVSIGSNNFRDCGGYPVEIITASSSASISVTGNTIRQTGTLGNGIRVSNATAVAITGNVVLFDGGASRSAIDTAGSTFDLVVGNSIGGGLIGTITGTPTVNANNI